MNQIFPDQTWFGNEETACIASLKRSGCVEFCRDELSGMFSIRAFPSMLIGKNERRVLGEKKKKKKEANGAQKIDIRMEKKISGLADNLKKLLRVTLKKKSCKNIYIYLLN